MWQSMKTKTLDVGYEESEKLRIGELQLYSSVIEENQPYLNALVASLAKLCKVPFAGISVVDHGMVWVKAHFGIDVTCIPRESAFCAAAVDSNLDLYVIEDALISQKFKDNPLVTKPPNIRFYAASPFIGDRGFTIGTLWIMDTKRRVISNDESVILRSMGAFLFQTIKSRYKNNITNLPNKECFLLKLQAILNRSPDKLSVGVIEIQKIRFLKKVYGDQFCNELIKSIGDRLSSWGHVGQMLGHFGDGDFAFVQMGNEHEQDLDKLLMLLTAPEIILNHTISVTAKIGIATTEKGKASAVALVNMAEIAVFDDQSSGFSAINYQEEDDSNSQLSIDLRSCIYREESDNQLLPYYQPQIDVTKNEIVGFEALLRWHNPRYSSVPTGKLFTTIESMGITPMVDLLIFRKVCRDIAEWKQEGVTPPKISTNISRTTLQRKNLVQSLFCCTEEFGISTNDIYLEVTEMGFQADDKLSSGYISELRKVGFRIAIDDFGTGMSNIATLRDTQCHLLKIDRQFVHGVSANTHIASLLRLIKGTADALEIDLLCEGVETQEDLDWLINANISLVQGWFFSKAIPKEIVFKVLQTIQSKRKQQKNNLLKQLFEKIKSYS